LPREIDDRIGAFVVGEEEKMDLNPAQQFMANRYH
jgi:hypothetical protein